MSIDGSAPSLLIHQAIAEDRMTWSQKAGAPSPPKPANFPSADGRQGEPRFQLRRAANGTWYVHWSEGRRSKRATTRTKELKIARKVFSTWTSPTAVPVRRARKALTCGELWRFYMKEHVTKKCASPETHKFSWKALAPRFENMIPAHVTQQTIDDHLAARAPAGCFVEFRLLAASWNFAVKKHLVRPESIPSDLDLPIMPGPRERWLREEEVERLLKAAEEMREGSRLSRVERFVWLALHTAGRRNALLELRWEQVDLEIGVVHLNPPGRRQTTKRRASVPISEPLMQILKRAYDERISELVLDRSNRLHDLLDRVAKRAGVKGVTAHVFRHTAATWMARRGVPLWKIAKILGNSVEQVERVYAKFTPDDLRDAVNMIGMGKPPESL